MGVPWAVPTTTLEEFEAFEATRKRRINLDEHEAAMAAADDLEDEDLDEDEFDDEFDDEDEEEFEDEEDED